MKNFKNLIKIGLVAVVALVSTKADSFFATNNLAASTNHFVIQGPVLVSKIILSTTNDLPTIVKFYDGYPHRTNVLWTNFVSYTTNITVSHITSTGVTNEVTSTKVYFAPQVNAAAFSFQPPAFVFSVDKLNPVSFDVTGNSAIFSRRVTLDNSAAGVNAAIQYRSP